ncbi:MAG: GTP-binding protein, partial [Desulfotignum sp.]|nr:GTP-binding protein [Desulfotignum sp.]
LFRIKGPVRFAHKTMMLNFVGGKWQWQEWQNEASTHLVFIGWNVVKDDILEKLNACMVTT